jgi:hypothetical protein
MGLAAAAVLGYCAIVAPGEARLRAIAFHTHELYELANRNARIREHAGDIAAARARVVRDLQAIAAEGDAAGATLVALKLLEREGAMHRVAIAGFAPAAFGDGGRDGRQDVNVAVSGSYQNVIGLIGNLSRGDALMEVAGVKLDAAGLSGATGEVDATIHATIFHGLHSFAKEVRGAATALH